MVLPLIWLGGLAISAIVGVTIYNKWDDIKKSLRGKNFIILGQRSTGKTTLMKFMLQGEIVLDSEATVGVSDIKSNKKNLSELGLNIKLCENQKDYSGVTSNYELWNKAIAEADIFVYLLNVAKWLDKPDIIEYQLERDINNIQDKIKENIPIFIIGSHLDLLQNQEFHSKVEKTAFTDDLQKETFFKKIKSQLGSKSEKVYIGFGNLNTRDGLEDISKFIISSIMDRA